MLGGVRLSALLVLAAALLNAAWCEQVAETVWEVSGAVGFIGMKACAMACGDKKGVVDEN